MDIKVNLQSELDKKLKNFNRKDIEIINIDHFKEEYLKEIFNEIKEKYEIEKIFINPRTKFKFKKYLDKIFRERYSKVLFYPSLDGTAEVLPLYEYLDMVLVEADWVKPGYVEFNKTYINLG